MTNEIEDIRKKLHDEIKNRLVGEWTGIAVNEIKNETPVITGRLKGSITGEGSFDGEEIVIGTETDESHFAESGVVYAAFVEFGTSKMSARRMFQKGLDTTKEIMEEDIAKLVKEEFDEQFSKFLKRTF